MAVGKRALQDKIFNLDSFPQKLKLIRDEDNSIALCHGVFDLLHPGHIQHFKAARNLADVLIVSLTADHFVNKGPGRPLFNEDIRAETLAALADVDYVVICNFPTAIELIEVIKPDFYVKGSDYINPSDDVTGMIAREKEVLETHGGRIHFTNELTSSSSMLINKFFSPANQTAQDWLRGFKSSHGYDEVTKALDDIFQLRVLILGETIIDQYTYCSPLAKSSKDPILAFHQEETNFFPGGAVTIANNCSSWAAQTRVISFSGRNDSLLNSLKSKIDSKIELDFIETPDRPTILKHRYVDRASNSRVFEYYDFSNQELLPESKVLIEAAVMNQVKSYDLVMAADYGHGFFTQELISTVERESPFLSVNTQANAGNRGYNTISKYSKADLITMNGGELQLELRDRNPDYFTIVPKLMEKMQASYAIVTLGGDGLIIFDRNGNHEQVPALAGRLIDKVGAGDAVFAIASLLAKVNAPLKVIGFLANLVAAHEVSQLGHQSSLSQADLRKHAKSILG